MAEVRQTRAFQLQKAKNLFGNARICLQDAQAPATIISAQRRFDAAYDCALACANLLLECQQLEVSGLGHHKEAMSRMTATLKFRGENASLALAMVSARNSLRYDAAPFSDESTVAQAFSWAQRVLDETETWLQTNSPLVLKP